MEVRDERTRRMSTIVTANVKRPSGSPDNISTEYIVEGTSKSWVRGSDAAVEQSSFNISSGTDNGTGRYEYGVSASYDAAHTQMALADQGSTQYYHASRNVEDATLSVIATYIFINNEDSLADKWHAISAHGTLA